MEVILTSSVRSLGNIGDKVKVKLGYARNYLFPQDLALPATEESLRRFEKIKKKKIAIFEEEKKKAQEQCEKINEKAIEFIVKVNEDGKLYGALSVSEIAEKILSDFQIEVRKKDVGLSGSIREIGEYPVVISIHSDVSASLTVQVKPDKESEKILKGLSKKKPPIQETSDAELEEDTQEEESESTEDTPVAEQEMESTETSEAPEVTEDPVTDPTSEEQ